MIIAEGFPPSDDCRPFFQSVLSKVHKREYFTENVLKHAIEESGFEVISCDNHIIHKASVATWLKNAVPEPKLRREILKQHFDMPSACQKAYNMTKENGDCLIDLRFCIFICQTRSN